MAPTRLSGQSTKAAQTKRSVAARKGHKTRKAAQQTQELDDQRLKHEANQPQRYMDAFELHDVPHWKDRVSIGSLYSMMGYRGGDAQNQNVWGQMELPGMHHPEALPTPRRWEEYSDKERQDVVKAARKFGVTEDTAHRSLSAHIDQANVRERGQHASFYSSEGVSATGSNLPRTQLRESARRNNVRFAVQAMSNAMTSPNNRFLMRPKSGPRAGQTVYPNDEAASFAIQWAREGKTGEEYLHHPDYHVPKADMVPDAKGRLVRSKDDPRKYPVQGYPRDMAKAIDANHRVNSGMSVPEAWGLARKSTGRSDYGNPKVAPYFNSWVDHDGPGQFWVSDTHSGPAAFAPHLNPRQQEQYMGIDGIHAFHDYVARRVMRERGLNSLTGMQSQDWSQEKHDLGHAADIADMAPHPTMPDGSGSVHKQQSRLF